jgi:hypothetical protein
MTSAPSLYRQVMGEDFHLLPSELQVFHSTVGRVTLSGQCTVIGPNTVIGKLMGWVFALPKTTDKTHFSFEIEANTTAETWRRHFPGRLMTSRMSMIAGRLVERLGPVDLHFRLKTDSGQLVMLLERVIFCGIPCPGFLLPSVIAAETASPGKLHFNVAARLPLVGLLSEYRGFLNVEPEEG